jgi:hypothetical protein
VKNQFFFSQGYVLKNKQITYEEPYWISELMTTRNKLATVRQINRVQLISCFLIILKIFRKSEFYREFFRSIENITE